MEGRDLRQTKEGLFLRLPARGHELDIFSEIMSTVYQKQGLQGTVSTVVYFSVVHSLLFLLNDRSIWIDLDQR